MKSVERVARSEKHAIRKHGIPPKFDAPLLNSRLKEGRETEESLLERGRGEWNTGRKGREKRKGGKKIVGEEEKSIGRGNTTRHIHHNP